MIVEEEGIKYLLIGLYRSVTCGINICFWDEHFSP